jgi:lipoprotein-anchoring transpeptidase ErfK/SrfK
VAQQRVWLVEQDEQVSASWLVSGRKGTPKPGTYSVYSRSRWSSSKGCVRQRRADAEHLWNWAPDGTPVRVTA